MEFLTGLLASIIRPIIQEELAELKAWAFMQAKRLETYEKHDREAEELILAAEKATTPEEVKAHLRKLREARAHLRGV